MTTISLPLNIAKALASMIVFIDKDAHRLDRVYVEVLPGTVSAVASDRYAIIESIYSERDGDGSLNFQLTAESAKFITAIKTKHAKLPVEFTVDGDNLTVSADGTQALFSRSQLAEGENLAAKLLEHANGVERGDKVAPIGLNVALLSRVVKLLDYDGKKTNDWEFHTGQTDAETKKPSPIEAYASGAITYKLIQQPRLRTR